MYRWFSNLLNSPSKRSSRKSPSNGFWCGWKNKVHETMECRDENACAAALGRPSLYAGKKPGQHFQGVGVPASALIEFAITYLDYTAIRVAFHFPHHFV